MSDLLIVGKPLPRIDGPDKVTGETLYAADLQFAGMLHGKILRSTHAHARVVKIDTSKAEALPGVIAVVTAADLPPAARDSGVRSHNVLADPEVVFHGQPVAAVAAEEPWIAEEALELITVEYEVLPANIDVEEAMKPGARPTRMTLSGADEYVEEGHVNVEGGEKIEGSGKSINITNQLAFKRGDVDKGFAEADIVVEGRFVSGSMHQAYLEPQVAVADWDPNGRLTVWGPTQGQFNQRNEIARILGLTADQVRYISTEVGGGFGAKVAPLVQPITALLSMKAGRPVKVILSRLEDLLGTVPVPRVIVTGKLGAKNDGTLTTFKGRAIFDSGAFPAGPAVGAAMMMIGCYKLANFEVEGLEVVTNKVSSGSLRAPGMPEVIFCIDQLVDEVARKIGMDQIKIRRKNAVAEGDLMPTGKPWGRIGLIECLDALERSDLWQNKDRPVAEGKRRGVGVAMGGWPGGLQPANAMVKLNENGTITVVVGSNDISGVNTSFNMIAAEVLSVSMEKVRTMTGDTDTAPYAGLAAGSKTTYSGGKSVYAAALDARNQILQIAAYELDASSEDLIIDDGVVKVPGTEKAIPFARVAALSTGFGGLFGPVLGVGRDTVKSQAPGFTAQALELEVDEGTGNITVTNVAAAQDVGKALNMLSVVGQLEGGVVQGLGMGLTEELLYDDLGRIRNPRFLDYRLLTSLDVPPIECIIVEVPSAEGPFGARIVGEPSIITGSAMVANAVRDATGVRMYDSPLIPERVARALRDAKAAPAGVA